MVLNNAENIMYGNKVVDRIFCGKTLVWERNDFYWISEKVVGTNEGRINGYKGVPTYPNFYLNWNQEPKNVTRPFLENVLLGRNIMGEIDDTIVCVDTIDKAEYHFDHKYKDVWEYVDGGTYALPPNFYINYNVKENRSYCDKIGRFAFYGCVFSPIINENTDSDNQYVEIYFKNCEINKIDTCAFAYFETVSSGNNCITLGGKNNSAIIEEQAFLSCDWNIDIIFNCENIKIGRLAFAESTIKNVIFPSNIKEISIGEGAFYYCDNITELTLPNGITEISNNFYCCKSLATVQLPNTLMTIGENFLSYTAIESLYIPKSVERIYPTSLLQDTDSNFTYIEVDSENADYSSKDGILYNKDFTVLEKIPQAYFRDIEWEETKTLVLPDTLHTLRSNYMFNVVIEGTCNIKLPDSVMYIGNSNIYRIYHNCAINIPSSVKEISEYAFTTHYRSSLTPSIYYEGDGMDLIGNIPNTVERIGEYAFRGTTFYSDYDKTTKITPNIPTNSKYTFISEGCFCGCSSFEDCDLIISNNITQIGVAAFYECFLKSVTIPMSITSIGKDAFYSFGYNSAEFPKFYIYAGSYGETYVKNLLEDYPNIEYEYIG